MVNLVTRKQSVFSWPPIFGNIKRQSRFLSTLNHLWLQKKDAQTAKKFVWYALKKGPYLQNYLFWTPKIFLQYIIGPKYLPLIAILNSFLMFATKMRFQYRFLHSVR